MTRGESFVKNVKCTLGRQSVMSISAWCDLKKCTVLNLHDMFHNSKCNCQKQIAFSPKQFQLEGGSIKKKLKSVFKGTQTAWNKFQNSALNMASSYIGMAVSVKTKNPNCLDKQRQIF